MKPTIIVFLWIVGAVALFAIAAVIYDLVVSAQERKAKKAEVAPPDAAPQTQPSDPEPASVSKPHPKGTDGTPKPKKRKLRKKTERWTDRHKHRPKK